jgi:O-antigen/teichoic acid export membrane protein
MAVIQTVESILSSIAAILLVLNDFGIWSLLAPRVLDVIVQVGGIYGFKAAWKPKFGWNPGIARSFLKFGSKAVQGGILVNALDRVDDIWTGIFLGEKALGFYDRAYKFANYPRKILANPINSVAAGTYAQVKDDRQRLSKAFSMINIFMVRINFLLAGLLALIAPEFIRIVIGEKWMPMLDAFRLMIIYTLLDPIKITIANAITAAGYPEKVVRIRFVQLVIMILGLYFLAPRFDISGVAVAVNLMLTFGIAALLIKVREYVDYSLANLFLVPGISVVVGMVMARAAIAFPGILGSDWRTAAVKTAFFLSIYLGSLFMFDRKHIRLYLDQIKSIFLQTRENGFFREAE